MRWTDTDEGNALYGVETYPSQCETCNLPDGLHIFRKEWHVERETSVEGPPRAWKENGCVRCFIRGVLTGL